jgi:hypothetical protein
MTKETTKKYRLPALGKPKPKANKTSARNIGKAANEQFKQGYAEKDKKLVEGGLTVTQAAKDTADKVKKGVKLKNGGSYDLTRKRYARITGV